MCLYSSATASADKKSLKEEEEKRAEAEKRVCLLEKQVAGKLYDNSVFTTSNSLLT